MKSGFDINRIQGDGYLILPLSMSRLAKGQTPEFCYEILRTFLQKVETFSNDVIFLYTNGLYFNSDEVSFENRKKTNAQILNHTSALRNLIEKGREFVPGAIHYLPVDYVILNAPEFRAHYDALKKFETEDAEFKEALATDSEGREYTEANANFLIEEIAIAHTLRQKLVELPRTLVRSDMWRLIAYPGRPLSADIYQWKKKLLPQESDNPYGGAQYNLDTKQLVIFDDASSV
ncbi:MAG: hypothetical protein Q7S95_02760 [bacterium]|nr:hypothetical protein [bacterium]